MSLFYNQQGETISGGGGGSQVDWAALNKYIVEECDAEDGATLTGVISQFVDLGIQKQEDGKKPTSLDTKEKQEKYLEKWEPFFEGQEPPYFEQLKNHKTGEMEWFERWKQRPQQCFTFAIDFPDIMLDKGKFFGDENSKKRPLRIYLGGEFYYGKEIGNAIDSPLVARVRKTDSGGYSFPNNSLVYKMASATKSLDDKGNFGLFDIEKLLGKSCLFNIKVFLAEGKYLNQRISSPSPLMRGTDPIPMNEDLGGITFVTGDGSGVEGEVIKVGSISFIKENDLDMVKELSNHVINRARMASNWGESILRKQLEEVKEQEYPPFFPEGASKEASSKEESTPKKAAKAVESNGQPPAEEDFDEELPF